MADVKLLGYSVSEMSFVNNIQKTETFDLSHLSYPRDLENGELKDLRRAVTEACRKD